MGDHSDDFVRGDGPGVDGTDDSEDVGPVVFDAIDVDFASHSGVERPVVSGWVDPPEFLVGQVSELGSVFETEELEESEHNVAVGAGIGDDDFGFRAGFLSVDEVDDVE